MVKNRIAMLRKEQGINQKELGVKLGVAQTTVSAWETGKNEPDSESLNKMSQLFRVSVGYLLGFEGETVTRGLSKEEHESYVRQLLDKKEQERLERQIQVREYERLGVTEEELEGIAETQRLQAWQESELRGAFYETYLFELMGERLTQEQRQRAIKVLELMFPEGEN